MIYNTSALNRVRLFYYLQVIFAILRVEYALNLLIRALEDKKMHFILAFEKKVLSLHHQKRFGAMNSQLSRQSTTLLMLGSWVRAPASSPDDCRNAVVFFCLWCNCVVSLKRIFVIVCKHPYDIPFTEICIAYPPQTKKTYNLLRLYCGVTSVVYFRTAQARRSALPR